MPFDIPQSQWRYYRHWLILLICTEALMLIFNQRLFEAYCLIALLFLGGFLLRVLKLYPGAEEPLILDLSAVILSLIYAFGAGALGPSNWRFAIVLSSSVIILPHFIFIAYRK